MSSRITREDKVKNQPLLKDRRGTRAGCWISSLSGNLASFRVNGDDDQIHKTEAGSSYGGIAIEAQQRMP